MKKRTLLIAASLLAVALAAPLLYAAGRIHRMGAMGDRGFATGMMFTHLHHLKSELDLSDQQVDQLKAIGAQLREQNAPYRKSLRGGFLSVAQALVNNPNDLTAAQAQLDQQEQNERIMKQNALTAASKALNVLNADQRAKVSAFLAKRAARIDG